ncbi:MAG: hypothetical protein AAGB22_09640, partial [Bacteroidota bacterium]
MKPFFRLLLAVCLAFSACESEQFPVFDTDFPTAIGSRWIYQSAVQDSVFIQGQRTVLEVLRHGSVNGQHCLVLGSFDEQGVDTTEYFFQPRADGLYLLAQTVPRFLLTTNDIDPEPELFVFSNPNKWYTFNRLPGEQWTRYHAIATAGREYVEWPINCETVSTADITTPAGTFDCAVV